MGAGGCQGPRHGATQMPARRRNERDAAIQPEQCLKRLSPGKRHATCSPRPKPTQAGIAMVNKRFTLRCSKLCCNAAVCRGLPPFGNRDCATLKLQITSYFCKSGAFSRGRHAAISKGNFDDEQKISRPSDGRAPGRGPAGAVGPAGLRRWPQTDQGREQRPGGRTEGLYRRRLQDRGG